MSVKIDWFFRAARKGERPFETYVSSKSEVDRKVSIYEKEGWNVLVKEYDPAEGYREIYRTK